MKRGVFVRRYREPRADEEREQVRLFAEHGIEPRIVDEGHAPENILFFFGWLPEEMPGTSAGLQGWTPPSSSYNHSSP